MRIGIIDDNINWIKQAETILHKYGEQTQTPMELVSFYQDIKEELVQYEGEPLDVIFLDIDLKEDDINGIELAKFVNKRWIRCQIVYLTNYLSYATEVYDTRHSWYVLKAQFEEKLGSIFQKIIHEQEQSRRNLIFAVKGRETINLSPEEIIYFEREKRTTYIHTVWKTYEIADKLENVIGNLSNVDFSRCHESYLVYLPAVRKIKGNTFYLVDGTEIPISRKYMKDTRAAYMRWALTQMS